jgi:hypothetical protein
MFAFETIVETATWAIIGTIGFVSFIAGWSIAAIIF